MDWFAGEPTVEDTLSDPIIRAVMKCDDVEIDVLRRLIEDVILRLNVHDHCADGAPRKAA